MTCIRFWLPSWMVKHSINACKLKLGLHRIIRKYLQTSLISSKIWANMDIVSEKKSAKAVTKTEAKIVDHRDMMQAGP